MTNRFEFYKDKKGEFRWKKFSPNGKEIGNSGEGFKTKASVIKNAQLNGHRGNGLKGWTNS